MTFIYKKHFYLFMLFMCAIAFIGVPHTKISVAKPFLKYVELDAAHTDKGALQKAKDLFARYLGQWDIRFEDAVSYARYINLGGGSKVKYIVYYRKDGSLGECAQAGCSLMIFENFEENKWRILLNVSAYALFTAENERTNGLKDIYLRTREGKKIKWVFDGVQYVNPDIEDKIEK
mgnify:CR=1 FL=1